MDELLRKASFDKATVFESGYGLGFRQFEVRDLRFRVVPITGGGEYDAAIFVERGKRKEKVASLNRVLIIEGWDHPALEVATVESSNGVTVKHAKFAAFSLGWDNLLNEYLAARGALSKVIIDGRNRVDLAPRSGPARPIARETPPHTVQCGELEDKGSAQVLFEGSEDNLLLDRFERNPEARRRCIKHYGAKCVVCQFDFEVTFGDFARGFIHVHHLQPLAGIGHEYRVDPIKNLRPVCPNCHSALHLREPPLTPDELRAILERRRNA